MLNPAKELETLRARVDAATLYPLSPIQCATTGAEFIPATTLNTFIGNRITALRDKKDKSSAENLLLGFLEDIKTPNIVLEKSGRNKLIKVEFKDRAKIPKQQDLIEITKLLLDETRETDNSPVKTLITFRELKALHYLTRVSMGLADSKITLDSALNEGMESIPISEEAMTAEPKISGLASGPLHSPPTAPKTGAQPAEEAAFLAWQSGIRAAWPDAAVGSAVEAHDTGHTAAEGGSVRTPAEEARTSKWMRTTLSCFTFLKSWKTQVPMPKPLIIMGTRVAKEREVSDEAAAASVGSPTAWRRLDEEEWKPFETPVPAERSKGQPHAPQVIETLPVPGSAAPSPAPPPPDAPPPVLVDTHEPPLLREIRTGGPDAAGGPGLVPTAPPPTRGTTAAEDDAFQMVIDISLAEAIKLKFKDLENETLCDKFQYFLNYSSDIDKALVKIKEDREINDTEKDENKLYNSLIRFLKSSDDVFFIALREYILNRPDSPLGSDSGSISDFKDLKEASAIGVLVTSQKPKEGSSDKTFEHSYEAREQAVNFLCYRGEDNKYEIKDEYKQDKDKDTALLQHGIECFKDDEDKLFTKSPSFKGFKDFENGIKPILSSIPPLQTALSTLGFLFLGNRETDNTIHGIKFKPSHDPTRTNVKRIIKSSQFGPVL